MFGGILDRKGCVEDIDISNGSGGERTVARCASQLVAPHVRHMVSDECYDGVDFNAEEMRDGPMQFVREGN